MNSTSLKTLLASTLRHYQIDDVKLQSIEELMVGEKFRLFHLINAVLFSDPIETRLKLDFEVLKLAFQIYNGKQNLSKEEMGLEVNRTGEWARTKQIEIDKHFNRTFAFVQDIPKADNLQETELTKLDFICPGDQYCAKVNEYNSTNFSQKFLTRILGVLLRETHFHVGNNAYENWTNAYLISNRLKGFNFYAFIKDLRNKLGPNNPIRKLDRTWTFEDIISKFGNSADVELYLEIIECCRNLVDLEFEYILTDEKGVIIPRNAKKTIPEYLEETFDKLGYDTRGHTREDIFDYLVENYPEQDWNISSVSSYLGVASDTFRSLGKTGSFVRKSWLDEGADIILGNIPEVAAEILRRETLPLSLYDLTEKMSRYRRNMDMKSVYSFLNQRPELETRESFYGQWGNAEHSSFLASLKSGKGSVVNWKRFDGQPIDEIYKYMRQLDYPKKQVDYLFKIKITDGQIQLFEDKMYYVKESQGPEKRSSTSSSTFATFTKPKKDREILIAKLAGLEKTDGFRPATFRFEQALLRSILFYGLKDCDCAICGRRYLVNFLVAAHIKKRSLCDVDERRDPNIVMPACVFGCDPLFENGYLTVNPDGVVTSTGRVTEDNHVKQYIGDCHGQVCGHHNQSNHHYYAAHSEKHNTTL